MRTARSSSGKQHCAGMAGPLVLPADSSYERPRDIRTKLDDEGPLRFYHPLRPLDAAVRKHFRSPSVLTASLPFVITDIAKQTAPQPFDAFRAHEKAQRSGVAGIARMPRGEGEFFVANPPQLCPVFPICR
jgi:hypothetical protein